MAISYRLVWGAPSGADDVADGIVRLAGPAEVLQAGTAPDDLMGEGVVLRAGMWCRAGTARPREVPWPDQLEADFGLVETCWVVFREDGDRDRTWQQDEMVWLVSGLLATLVGDVALHFQYEVLWLVRQGGRLVVNERDDIWTPPRLAMLPGPYERAPLAFED